MSLCMNSAKHMPRAARLLASASKSRPSFGPLGFEPVRCRRWNSSIPPANASRLQSQGRATENGKEGEKERGKRRGWSTWKVVTIAAATGVLAHVLARSDAEIRRVKEREYSSPGKFSGPKYASLVDMEAVSHSLSPRTFDQG